MIATWSEGLADENMAEDILVELAGIVRRHPWWKARTALTLALLAQLDVYPPAWICDAGCGWGSTLAGLEPGAIAPSAWTSPAPCSSGSSARHPGAGPDLGRPDTPPTTGGIGIYTTYVLLKNGIVAASRLSSSRS